MPPPRSFSGQKCWLKSQAENTNIAKRMGKMEELEKAMTLLDKMRKVIGEDSFKAKVGSVCHWGRQFQSESGECF
jgi:hypothetical protein